MKLYLKNHFFLLHFYIHVFQRDIENFNEASEYVNGFTDHHHHRHQICSHIQKLYASVDITIKFYTILTIRWTESEILFIIFFSARCFTSESELAHSHPFCVNWTTRNVLHIHVGKRVMPAELTLDLIRFCKIGAFEILIASLFSSIFLARPFNSLPSFRLIRARHFFDHEHSISFQFLFILI